MLRGSVVVTMGNGGRLRQQVRETIHRYEMLQAGEKLLVAVSGGADSVGLLHLLCGLSDELGIELAVAHLNHKLRGEQADRDEAYVRRLCADWNLSCYVTRENVGEQARQKGISLEEAGRCARYEYFSTLAEQHGFTRVALGHTCSDRVETLLINLLRGSGLYGLRSIPPVRGIFIRPLIASRREVVAEYCEQQGLNPRCDESNLDPSDFLRNKIRLQLLPLLGEEYSEDPYEALLRIVRAAEEELDWTEPLVDREFEQIASVGANKAKFDRQKLSRLPAGLQQRLLRRALVELLGAATDVGEAHYDTVRKLLDGGRTGAQVYLPGKVLARIGYTELELVCGEQAQRQPEDNEYWCYELPVPGSVEIPQVGRVIAQPVAERPSQLTDEAGTHIIVDAEAVGMMLHVRNWRPGDCMQPLGMAGHKKLQDLFVDEKIPQQQRQRIPLVVDSQGRIIWVAGLRMGEQFRVVESTTKFLKLSVAPLADKVSSATDVEE